MPREQLVQGSKPCTVGKVEQHPAADLQGVEDDHVSRCGRCRRSCASPTTACPVLQRTEVNPRSVRPHALDGNQLAVEHEILTENPTGRGNLGESRGEVSSVAGLQEHSAIPDVDQHTEPVDLRLEKQRPLLPGRRERGRGPGQHRRDRRSEHPSTMRRTRPARTDPRRTLPVLTCGSSKPSAGHGAAVPAPPRSCLP
jgi:hypothetical protein